MKYKYTKYVPNLLDELDMDELMSKLSDLLMSSGFGNPRDTGDDSDRTMQALHDAILEALFNGGVLPDDLLEQLFGDAAEGNEEQARNQLEELIKQIIERMKESGYISTPPDLEPEKARRAMGAGALRLAHHLAVSVDSDRLEVGELGGDVLAARAVRIEVLDPEQEARSGGAGEEPGAQRRPQVAEVKLAGRRRGKAT